MIDRILPPEEWERLEGTELGPVRDKLPEGTQVIVVEKEGIIKATWMLAPLVHLEGFSNTGGTGVGRALLRRMVSTAKEMGAKVVITGAIDQKIERLIHKVGGVELEAKMFAINIERFP